MLEQLWGSKLRARVIGWLFTHPEERFYVRQLTELLAEDSTNLSRELARLESLGILFSERDGQQKYYRANPRSAIFDELKSIAVKTTGVIDVLRQGLEQHGKEIQTAFIFGSFARQEQTADSDIDVIIVGDVDGVALQDTISRVENQLRRTVNYSLFSRKEYREKQRRGDAFLASVIESPKLMVMEGFDGDR